MDNKHHSSAEVNAIVASVKQQIKAYTESLDTEYLTEVSAYLDQYRQHFVALGYELVSHFAGDIMELCAHLKSGQWVLSDPLQKLLTRLPAHLKALANDPTLTDPEIEKKHINLSGELKKGMSNDERPDSATDNSNARFREVFQEEAYDLINQLEECLLQLEGNLGDTEAINHIFRIVHTLKGNSNMFGYTELASITHYIENIYDDIRGGQKALSKDIFELTLNCLDHFRNLIEDPDLTDEDNKALQTQYLGQIKNLSQDAGDTSDTGKTGEPVRAVEKPSDSLVTYYIHFAPHSRVMDDGTNPLFLLSDLAELGAVITVPVSDALPADSTFDPSTCSLQWHILLNTEKPQEDLNEVFMFLDDKSLPRINPLAGAPLLFSEAFREAFQQLAASSHKPLETEAIINLNQGPKEKKAAANTNNQHISVIRVASQKIDVMMNLISELVTKQAELTLLAKNSQNTQLKEVTEKIENISRDLRDNAFSISLIPLEKSVLRFQRLVRDVSNKFDKKVNFQIEGKETELDKTIIEKMTDPVMHILRNGIDHGIEMPDERVRKGKPGEGTILLKAYPSGTNVVLEISDDGRGIDLEKVKQTAIQKGYLQPGDEPSRKELLDLIITPGFTTANQVSEVSGRGVGMDVVNQRIREIRGELEISTEEGVGTTIVVKLPLTISIIDSLLTRIGERNFIIPLAVIHQCEEIAGEELIDRENNYLLLNDAYVPFIDLRQEFSIQEAAPDYHKLVIINHNEKYIALTVDEIIGQYQAVLKPIGDVYRRQDIISGASILGNGEIALVIDTTKLVQHVLYKSNINDENDKKIAI